VEEARRRVEDKFYRVSVIERLLAFKDMGEEERDGLEEELEELKAVLGRVREEVATLEGGGSRSTLGTSTLLTLLGLCLYGLYRVFQIEHEPW